MRACMLLTSLLLLILPNLASADITLDLATADVVNTDQPATLEGEIGGATYRFGETPGGTGNFDTFLFLQANSTERGYNSDSDSLPFDAKSGTDAIKVGDMPVVVVGGTTYFEILLDINEQGNNGSTITLDEVRVYESPDDDLDTTDLDALGDLKYRLDTGMNNTVEMDAFNSGSGKSDYSILIPVWNNPDLDDYFTFYAEFSASSSGFEEFGIETSRTTLAAVPEPSAFALLGLVAGLAWMKKKWS